jgi:transcriptional regulator with XRE-family HTH domain
MPDMKREPTIKNFGKRLTALRRSAGLTQKQLGEKIGVSNRVIHYYETETNYPPAHLIDPLAKALKVSTDELLGIKASKTKEAKPSMRIAQRLKKIENLPPAQQKTLLKTIDTFIKAAQI